ncbi:ATP-dependent DNA helicase Q4, partial [Athene cunicularia]|uniref:ATP-dependent DNA helicase Q4 n=1 Tax=Athene cunicularia TaxID=194338 RepID=UPI000EF6B1D5
MERLREVKALLKQWEAAFLRERRRKPTQADIEAAPEDTKRLYKEYKTLKQQREKSDPSQLSPSCQPAAQETPTAEQAPDSGCWGAHLNRQPKTPELCRRSRAVPKTSAQYYGMKLKSNLGAAGKETPLTPRRTPIPKRTLAVPELHTNSGTGDKAASPAPAESSQSERDEPEDFLLPPSVSGLAPIILTAGLKSPPPPPPDKFQQLKRTVAQRLGSLDPAWLQRCQEIPEDKGTMLGATQAGEEGRDSWPPPEQDGRGGGALVGDSRRKRPQGDNGENAAAPAKLKRCRRSSAEGVFSAASRLKQSDEEEEKKEEEHVAAQKESGKVLDPSENILGELEEEEEEEEKPRHTRKASAARAPPRGGENFVRLNLKKKSHVRGYALRGNRLRKQLWKQKWQKKAEQFGGGGRSAARRSDVCFKCGGTGHWASACRGRVETAAGPLPEENGHADEEEEAPLPTLEEVARRTNTGCRELSESGGSDREKSEKILEASTQLDVWRPMDEPPTPPAPVEPLYSRGPEGKVQETPQEVFEALKALGYSSFRPGQEVAIMRILSDLLALVSLLQGERFGHLDSIIIYCTRREETNRIAALIRTCLQGAVEPLRDAAQGKKAKAKSVRCRLKWIADAYHAGLSSAERRRVQSAFMKGQLRVVVATVAFGMGLDKPDVRGIVHYNMPKNFESYVQEIGRAGRDGEPAHCHLFLDPEGRDLHELQRHIYGDSVDFFTIKKLVQKVFSPCKCLELHQKHQDVVKDGEVEDAEMAELLEEEEKDGGGVTRQSRQRLCYKHERALPMQQTVESLDIREE